jgi:sporulation protein YlmC with PRC-barrel domain
MRLSDLRDRPIRTLDGKRLGRVHEVHADGGRIVALKCGAASWIGRMTGKSEGRTIAWDRVRKVDTRGVTVAPAVSGKDGTEASAARSRRGTRPASGRRSGR